MKNADPNAVLAPSTLRRGVALVCLFGLGATLIYLGVVVGTTGVWTGLVIVMGALILWAAELMRRGTRDAILLTKDGLVTQKGLMLAPAGSITKVERALFAIKPTNGFLVHLAAPLPWLWVPGLYWRLWRFVGIGGITSAPQGRFMAEAMQAEIHERDTSV